MREQVVEIAFDRIMRSTRHKSGFAMRFPRIVRLRDDKTPAEIDTMATVEKLFEAQATGLFDDRIGDLPERQADEAAAIFVQPGQWSAVQLELAAWSDADAAEPVHSM